MSRTLAPARPAAAPAQRRPVGLRVTWAVGSVVLLALLVALSVAVGARTVPLGDVVTALTGGGSGLDAAVVTQRVPRTVLAVLVGAALALAGAVMQGVTRNPLADPGLLGVSSGAALFVVVGITAFGLSSATGYLVVAVAGSAVAATFVYAVGALGRGGATPLKLALSGAATSAALSSLVSAILLPRVDVMTRFRFWQIGGVGGASWDRIAVALPVLAAGALLCLAMARGLNSLALGDDLAAGLGVHVRRTRLLAAAGAVVLAGAATAIAGPIGFVGLVVPHVVRTVVGSDHRWLLPLSAVGGSALLVLADVVGRVVARPSEVDVGIVTALVGAPFFVWIVRRRTVREL
ncbi:FecCD family ABC transporter permease [Lapillicoccus jejuensis]|uniref:Iron complex transport system permease protein n=1 Tax=Lapillicoccus jejuensis TaxID=402171 RepID=A0A542E102_9MICO|nr:iron ABC transporter permease [Lapillicoccus jejuensis]TQJ09002.1 iron complex transport system permease protein [Lapillicoccus jejuensis]